MPKTTTDFTNAESTPGLTPPSIRRTDSLYEVWKTAEPWQQPAVEQRLLQCLRQHASRLCWIILHSHEPDLVEEIAVDTILALKSFEGRSAFSTWFHARAKYKCMELLRKRILRNEVQIENVMGTLGRVGNIESDYVVREMLASLTDAERELVFLKVYDGCSDADIAETLGVSRQKVQWLWSRLRKRLRDLYGGKTSE
jgi:RNA polymerase sigma factor (sigma-70 family)